MTFGINSELTNFMDRKNRESKGEVFNYPEYGYYDEDDDIIVPAKEENFDQKVPVNVKITNAFTFSRILVNIVFVIPIILSAVFLMGYIFLDFIPAAIIFFKRLLTLVTVINW